MTRENSIERFLRLLQARVPDARLSLDRPEKGKRGPWWLDATRGKSALTVEWWPGFGFGVFVAAQHSRQRP